MCVVLQSYRVLSNYNQNFHYKDDPLLRWHFYFVFLPTPNSCLFLVLK